MPAPSTPVASEGEPMQIGMVRSALTSDERLRRRQVNLSLHCGGARHFLRNCPVRPSKSSPHSPMYLQIPGPSPTHLVLHVSLQVAEGRSGFQQLLVPGHAIVLWTLPYQGTFRFLFRPRNVSLKFIWLMATLLDTGLLHKKLYLYYP